MAQVRITPSLCNEVAKHIDMLYKEDLDAANVIPEATNGVLFKEVYEGMYAQDHRDKMAELPAFYFSRKNTLHVEVPNIGNVVVYSEGDKEYPITQHLDRDINQVVYVRWASATDTTPSIRIERPNAFPILIKTIEEREKRVSKVEHECARMKNNMRATMQQYGTLRPMLKDHPEVWDLLPSWAKEQHTKITERTPKEKVKVVKHEHDLSDLTARVVMKTVFDKKGE